MRYFIDEINGNDINDGLTTSLAKKSITKVIDIIQPKDEIYCLSDINIDKFSDLFYKCGTTDLSIYFNKHALYINNDITIEEERPQQYVYLYIYQAKIILKFHSVYMYQRNNSDTNTQFYFYNCVVDLKQGNGGIYIMNIPGNALAEFYNCTFKDRISISPNITLNNCVSKFIIQAHNVNNCTENKSISDITYELSPEFNLLYGIYSGDYSWFNKNFIIIINYNNHKYVQNIDNTLTDVSKLSYEDILLKFKNSIESSINLKDIDNNKFYLEYIKL